MRVPAFALRGMGDAQCGDNPCTTSDLLSPSAACATYLGCETQAAAAQSFSSALSPLPGIPLTTAMQLEGAGVADAASYGSSLVAQGVAAGVQGATGLAAGSIGNTAIIVAGVVLAGLALLFFMKR
jgi:LPXTG-motif cell wall-anchored protein